MTANKLNILWICSDQQRADTLGCYGNRFTSTPNLDRLAKSGVTFDNAFCQSPECTPSRASFLTGRYPGTTGAHQNGTAIRATEKTVVRSFRENGYATGLSGKLHLSACKPTVYPHGEPRIDDGYDEFHWSHHPSGDGGNNWVSNEYTQWLFETGRRFTSEPFNGSKHVLIGPHEESHQTTWCVQKALNFMQAAGHYDQPWFYSVNFFDPHHPFDPPREYLERYLSMLEAIPLPRSEPDEYARKPVFLGLDGKGAYNTPGQYPAAQMSGDEHRLVRAAYWAMCDLIDHQIGRLLDGLEADGQLDNTLIIYTSDHGEMLGDHGVYCKGPHFYDSAVRVPLIISCPGSIRSDYRYAGLTELTDIAPTLLEAAGLPPEAAMQGRSLWPLLTGEKNLAGREDIYCEYYNNWSGWVDHPVYSTMLRTENAKIVSHALEEPGELYDLITDPDEMKNLWDDPGSITLRATLQKRLCDRMAMTIDPLPIRQTKF